MNGYTNPHSIPSQPVMTVDPNQAKREKTILIVGIIVAIILGLIFIGRIVVEYGDSSTPIVGVINIDGSIGSDGGGNSSEGFMSLLNSAARDDSIKAVVLRVNSGGGTSGAGMEMAQYVKEFPKPIVVSTEATNASAAYLISSQADWIFANEGSLVGSIGTRMQMTDYSRLLDMLGIEVTDIVSSSSKNAGNGTRSLTEEEIAYFQVLVDQINDAFINEVAEGRDMDPEAVRELATGMVFTAEMCIENGLIDEIGTFKDALNEAAAMANLRSFSVEYLGSNSSLQSLLNLFMKTDVKTENTSTEVLALLSE